MTGHVPERLGRYRLVDVLGRGGMGVVYRGLDEEFEREVAVKVIEPSIELRPDMRRRFLREARLAARLRHPYIVPILAGGEVDGRYYYASRLVEGQSLDHPSITGGSLERKTELVARIAEALQYAHDREIIHRDIKPGNVLVDDRGNPQVLDFGLARDLAAGSQARITGSADTMGSPCYMSPEQADGRTDDVGPASDQFSLAVVAYELLAGRRPFGGDSLREILNATCEADPVPPRQIDPAIPPEVDRAIVRALAKDPALRYPTMAAFGAALRRGDPTPAAASIGPGRRWRLPLLVAAALLLPGGLGLVAWRASSGDAGRLPDRPESTPRLERARRALAIARAACLEEDVPAGEFHRLGSEARAAIDDVPEADLDEATRQAWIGLAWAAESRYEEAEARWLAALAADPDQPEALYSLGCHRIVRVALRPADYYPHLDPRDRTVAQATLAEARGLLRRFLSLEAGPVTDRAVARAFLLELGHEDRRRTLDETILRLEAEGDAGKAGAALLLLVIGRSSDRARSAPWIERALDLTPSDPRALLAVALLELWEEGDAGIERFDRVVALAPEMAEAYFWRAMRLQRTAPDDRPAILSDLDEALRIDPDWPMARYERGVLRMHAGDPNGALADHEAGLRLAPRDAFLRYGRARLHEIQDHRERALEDLDVALTSHPGFVDALELRSRMRAEAGDFEGSLEDCNAILAREPERFEFLSIRGALHNRFGDREKAIADFERALRLAPLDWDHRDGCLAMLARLRSGR